MAAGIVRCIAAS